MFFRATWSRWLPPMEKPSPSPPKAKTWRSSRLRLIAAENGSERPWMKWPPWVLTKYGKREEQPMPAIVTMLSCG